jgi:hypothetical protein
MLEVSGIARHLARGLDLAPAFLNLCNDTIDTGRHFLRRGAWEEHKKFVDEILPHPSERRGDLGVRLVRQ